MAQPIQEQQFYIFTDIIHLHNIRFIYSFPYIIDIQYELLQYSIDFITENFNLLEI